MNVDLFLRNVPPLVKELIGREALQNRRSLNQEAIALLEEALLRRVEDPLHARRSALEALRGYADSQGVPLDLPADHTDAH